ncbi:aminoacyl-tRNA hydrolase [Evansella sp. AB-P1]|uniref:aminoacyl-tRNA hydrolase n=1 Tax=Evansella sp. AB-P1 TaxID=3037653 RepID=UPI00241F7309|nr:aminoacyl-tRNA hydrolase [Evansella sp. AB-P1]MDG5789983.1 aminoacyl-tRNA hydrolase [Evansella sp. AB-P1]
MKLVVGLGNPGNKFDQTRHNIGFEVIDKCLDQLSIDLDQSKFKGIYGYKKVGDVKLYLLKPMTYMNLSGESIIPLMKYYKIEKENLLVVYDDLDLPPGTIRLRQKGSHGGHNGIKSIISHLGSDQFNRIRVGIGRPSQGQPVPDYVLGKFNENERKFVDETVEKAANAVEAWTTNSFINVMNEYN